MKDYYLFKIEREKFEGHVERICKTNLIRSNVKICYSCPFIKNVLSVMENKGLNYLKEYKKINRK